MSTAFCSLKSKKAVKECSVNKQVNLPVSLLPEGVEVGKLSVIAKKRMLKLMVCSGSKTKQNSTLLTYL